MAYSEMKEASTYLNDQLHFSTSGNGLVEAHSWCCNWYFFTSAVFLLCFAIL